MKPAYRKSFLNPSLVAALLSSALVGTAIAPPVAAGSYYDSDTRLRGSYAFTTARTCVNSLDPISPPSYVVQSILSRQSSTDSGILKFNGDGTASAVGIVRTLDLSASDPRPLLTVNAFTSDITYSVNDDRTVDMTTNLASFNVVFPQGINVVGTSTGETSRLQIGENNAMLVSAPSGEYSVEVLVFTAGPVGTRYRLCTRSTTAVKIPDEDGDWYYDRDRR